MCYHIGAIILIDLDFGSGECADLEQDYLVKIADEEVLRSFEAVVEISPESLDRSLWFSRVDMPGGQCRMKRRVKSRDMKNYLCILCKTLSSSSSNTNMILCVITGLASNCYPTFGDA